MIFLYATVSDINTRYDKDTHEKVYADGYYSKAKNTIYINPDGKRSVTKALIHELTHALYTDR